MVSSPLLCSLLSYLRLHPTSTSRPSSRTRVFSDTPSPSLAFEADLAEQLQRLTHSCSHGNVSSSELISLNWICKALEVVLSTQASVKQALLHGKTPICGNMGPHSDKVIQQHMEDIAKMLDACCLIKEALSVPRAYVKSVRLALKRIQSLQLVRQGDNQRAKHALLSAKRHVQERSLIIQEEPISPVKGLANSTKRLQACSSMLRRMGDKLPTPQTDESLQRELAKLNTDAMASSTTSVADALQPAALYGGEIATLFFLRLVSTALSTPESPARRSSVLNITPLQVSGQQLWGSSLLSLQAQLNTQLQQIAQRNKTQRCNMTLFPELHNMGLALDQIYETVVLQSKCIQYCGGDDVQHLVASTSIQAEQVERHMSTLHHHIDNIFLSLIDIRMTLIKLY